MKKSKKDEDFVETFLIGKHLLPEKFPGVDSKRRHKAPDFRVSSTNGKFFFCEVKSIFTATGNNGILHSTKHNSLADNIHQAAKQFSSVNSQKIVPNVLAWVSHNMQINEQDLYDLLTGRISIDKKLHVDLGKYRFGRIKNDINLIDLHIWICPDGVPSYIFFNNDRMITNDLMQIFNIDQFKTCL